MLCEITSDQVNAAGTVVAGVAAVASAWFAHTSKRASDASAANLAEALSATIVPDVTTGGVYQHAGSNPLRAYVSIGNRVDFDARKVEVEVLRRDGRRFTSERDVLRKIDEPISVEIGELDGPTLEGYEFLIVNRVTIRFSDDRELARYERTEEYAHLTEPPGVPTVREHRLSPNRGPFYRQPGRLA